MWAPSSFCLPSSGLPQPDSHRPRHFYFCFRSLFTPAGLRDRAPQSTIYLSAVSGLSRSASPARPRFPAGPARVPQTVSPFFPFSFCSLLSPSRAAAERCRSACAGQRRAGGESRGPPALPPRSPQLPRPPPPPLPALARPPPARPRPPPGNFLVPFLTTPGNQWSLEERGLRFHLSNSNVSGDSFSGMRLAARGDFTFCFVLTFSAVVAFPARSLPGSLSLSAFPLPLSLCVVSSCLCCLGGGALPPPAFLRSMPWPLTF